MAQNIISNECRLGGGAGAECLQDISFDVVPKRGGIGRIDIATRNPAGRAKLRLQITGDDGNTLREIVNCDTAHNGYTAFVFEPIIGIAGTRLSVRVTSDTPGAGVVLDPDGECGDGVLLNRKGSIGVRLLVQPTDYTVWLANNAPDAAELERQRNEALPASPLISVVTPLCGATPEQFDALLNSLISQTYGNWELCAAGDAGLGAAITSRGDSRLRYCNIESDNPAELAAAAAKMCAGEYICFLDTHDTLAPHALYSCAEFISQNPGTGLFYPDEDKISQNGDAYSDPYFKPDYSPDLLMCCDYTGGLTVISRGLSDAAGGIDIASGSAYRYDLTLRAAETAGEFGHISDILYHRRQSDNAGNDIKSDVINALDAALKRRGYKGEAVPGKYLRVNYYMPAEKPPVSIIIPNRNECATLKKCVNSIINKSTYGNYEIIIVENNSTEPDIFEYYNKITGNKNISVIENNIPFNYSAFNNFGAKYAHGKLLLFLNNDTKVITPDWIEQMAMHALRPEVGAVGAKLLYPDGTVQHAGVVAWLGGVAGHPLLNEPGKSPGPHGRLATVHNVSAVTGACMMLGRQVFEQAGGFWEELGVAFNDVDLCLNVLHKGYYNVFTPHAVLYHYESKTRGYENTPEKTARFNREAALLINKWRDVYPHDRFYNRNLSLSKGDYSIK